MATKFFTVTAVMVLTWADSLAYYVLWMTMTYLTNVWKIGFTYAAAILNLWSGASQILPIALAHLADAFVGNFTILVITTISYVAGLGLLAMSTPPMFAKHGGACPDYKPECIGEEQKHLFYIGLGLIALGAGGHLTSLGPFVAEQLDEEDVAEQLDEDAAAVQSDEEDYENGGQVDASRKQGVTMFLSVFGIVMVPIVGIIVIPYVKPWSVRYGIAAVFSLAAMSLFLVGCFWYKYVGPQGSSLTTIARVFVASTTKLFYRRPTDAGQLYERSDSDDDHAMSYSSTRAFCCLDKAAIVLPSQPLEEQKKNRWRLCTVTEVEGTKIVLRMIPMWLTFIACGLVSSIGNTFFLEQANRMNPKVGRLKVPLPVLLFFYDQAKQQSAKLYYQITASISSSSDDEENPKHSRYAPPVGIAVSMIFAILCCITAAKVEERRLGVVASHGLVDKPDERTPMTMFWLVPQYVLLGLLDGVYDNSVDCFFEDQGAASMRRYMGLFSGGVFGAGVMGSALSVYVVGRISGRGERRNWFQATINKSRLDKYYWVLAAISAVNVVVFGVVACLYKYRESSSEGSEAPEYEETDGERFEDNGRCCC